MYRYEYWVNSQLIKPFFQEVNDVTRSLVLALGVCYHACLKNREQYREAVARYFTPPLLLPGGADQIEEEILKYVWHIL